MTDDQPIDLVARRNEKEAERTNDARAWTPLDCLKALVRDLENGSMEPVAMVYVAMARKNGDNGQVSSFPCYVAGGSRLEIRGLLSQHLSDVCK